MSYRFNSGMGGITCDTCNTLVVSGRQLYPGKELIAIPTHDGEELHFCSNKCKNQYKPKYQEHKGEKYDRADRERRRREKGYN